MSDLKKKKLVVLTSTLPRWEGDSTPSFVLDHAKLLAPFVKEVVILAPHFKGALSKEAIGTNIRIKRVKYFLPSNKQDIFYGGDAVKRVSKSPIYVAKLLFYTISMINSIIWLRPGRDMIINANWMIPQGYIAIMVKQVFRRTQVVTTVRGVDIFDLNGKFPTMLKKTALKKSDEVFVNSMQMKKACEKILAREYIQTPTGFDDKLFTPKNTNQYKKSGRNLKVFSAGRLIEGKGFIYILKAVKRLRDKGITVKLKIAGEGPEKESLEKYIENNQLSAWVQIVGWVTGKELVNQYREADIFVGASIVTKTGWREAFGNVYAESMACGTPVVVTNTAGNSEIIQNGVNGFVINSRSVDDIVEKLEFLSSNRNKIKPMGLKAIESIKPYTKSATRDLYIKVFEEYDVK